MIIYQKIKIVFVFWKIIKELEENNMKNKLKGAVSTLMIATILAIAAVPVSAAQVAGGTWDY